MGGGTWGGTVNSSRRQGGDPMWDRLPGLQHGAWGGNSLLRVGRPSAEQSRAGRSPWGGCSSYRTPPVPVNGLGSFSWVVETMVSTVLFVRSCSQTC